MANVHLRRRWARPALVPVATDFTFLGVAKAPCRIRWIRDGSLMWIEYFYSGVSFLFLTRSDTIDIMILLFVTNEQHTYTHRHFWPSWSPPKPLVFFFFSFFFVQFPPTLLVFWCVANALLLHHTVSYDDCWIPPSAPAWTIVSVFWIADAWSRYAKLAPSNQKGSLHINLWSLVNYSSLQALLCYYDTTISIYTTITIIPLFLCER